MKEEQNPGTFDYPEALIQSLMTVDPFGFGGYQNLLPRWVFLSLLIGLCIAIL